jgi:hypothetical protein
VDAVQIVIYMIEIRVHYAPLAIGEGDSTGCGALVCGVLAGFTADAIEEYHVSKLRPISATVWSEAITCVTSDCFRVRENQGALGDYAKSD